MIHLNTFRSVLIGLAWFLIVCIVFSCGSESDLSSIENQNNMIVKMMWLSNTPTVANPKVFDENICDDFGIQKISLDVHNSSSEFITNRHWVCDKHKGSISGVPTGHGYKIHVKAFVKDKAEWSSEVSNIVVNEGETLVEVAMEYKGSDITPPAVNTVLPKDNAVKVPVNTSIEVTFSEGLAHSSIDESSFVLYEGQTPVSGEIFHTVMTPNIVFKPSSALKKNTKYTVKLTNDIKDCANLYMTDEQTFSFTTIADEPPPPSPKPPKGFKAIAGNGKINLSWNAVAKSEAYTLYMGETKGVTTDPSLFQTAEVAVTSYEWAPLDNNKTYYFIVTAKNITEESAASVEISATPSDEVPFKKDLTLYYDFSGGNAIDLSGNGNDGLITSAIPAMDKLGEQDRALMFNGKDSYIEISPLSHFAPLHFTIVMVINVENTNKTQYLLKKGAAKSSFSLFLTSASATIPSCPFYSQPESPGIYGKKFQYRLMNHPPFPVKEFVHIAITLKKIHQNYSKAYVLKPYINGVPQKKFKNLPELFHSNSSLFIGKGGTYKSPCYFNGIIDDLMIYRRVLSSVEIQSLFEFSGVKNQVVSSELWVDEDEMDDDYDFFPQALLGRWLP